MAKKKEKYSPMMTKYLELKKDYQDSIVFYRLGDFYEMFFDDAIVASKALNIALTGKNAGVSERVPMCGVPFHSAQGYIEDLVKMGHKVVIVEQLTDPKASKGLVERGVVQIVTPGTIMDLKLNEKVNHFIGALGIFDFHYTLAYADISTGEFYCLNLEKDDRKLKNQIETLDLKELVMNQDGYEDDSLMISHYDNEHIQDKYKKLFEGVSDLKEIKVASNLLNYMLETQKRDLDYIQPLTEVDQQNYVVLDASTKKALELTKNSNQEKYGTLLWLLDHTHSAMGGRMLKSWIDHPLLNKDAIEERLDMVEIFVDNLIERETIKDMINEIYDIEKLASRIAFGNVNARDLKWIASSLQVIPELKHQLLSLENEKLNKLAEQLLDLTPITELIESAIVDNPPLVIKEGNIIKEGYSAELDEYRDAKKNGQNWLREFEEKEKQRTGIQKLKIGYNRVFGYYIEVTKSQLNLVKDEFNYTRKQSLTNAERFITPELKEMEDKILSAQDRIVSLEYEIFSQIRQYIKQYVHMIQDVAKVVAKVDVYISLAIVASSNRYVRPTFNDEHRLHIVEGKHPIVEEVISSKNYIANDVDLDEKNRIMMITGPNMGGKSTYMRQVTLTVLMAQMGSFVPAREADLPIFDQIFTRIGASDDLVSGQSTFMVEMLEANNALRYATEDSLIIFDEIGRGTATFDGMALAQGIVEYIAKKTKALTLFSTHYHELTLMNKDLGIKNVHASADVSNDSIKFLYKIKEGATGQSYGINVAKLAKLPDEVIARAKVILDSLQDNNMETKLEASSNTVIVEKESAAEKMLSQIDPMQLSPIDALSTLIELKKLL
ncbi:MULTISPECIES: DNA mismatch repair protein MutS [Kandleria]|jgi:DNA mismatch repair protein MutS|uniref:DNA mismatch repair protein MutS n=1 Tax=Kandleria vitulina DSM 20405 TaxID=1410657 RepID=A0A0R2HLT1_9FIRM|nr:MULTISPECIES: DNA mismatch repair protein MutS [Kandleria]KRN50791.1 DNA mismatch repair protein MutS [Kandleria vitulina DSM 20405]MBP3277103.1 DNA mismatch repair protein MutS [Kandleria sp.]MEE0988663.1 DNA mismatch repair protein MutS [Kandleria vitulina]HAH75277.1 DNA mismatch repair protein MutS [Kandleria vitulina]